MNKKYSVKKVRIFSIFHMLQVERILYRCGKNMAKKEGLHHWDNSKLKSIAIVFLCSLKNNIHIVYDSKKPVATFQIKQIGDRLKFQKIAVDPEFSCRGIGSFCIEIIEERAKKDGCKSVFCEVYDKSQHAITFYSKKGYAVVGKKETLKYKVWIMERNLG